MTEKKGKDQYQGLADSLADETLKEAADHFFGERKSIEEALQIYQENVQKLRDIQMRVEASQANLHFLLRRGESSTVSEFYRQIGVEPDDVPELDADASADLSLLQVPRRFGPRSKYAGLVCNAYAAFVTEANDYMNGRYYDDPQDSRRKRITVNYRQLANFCQEVNERIDRANQYNSPSQILQFFKQLDIERSEKESLIGVPTQYSLDEEMSYAPEEFACARLASYPDLPSLSQVEGRIRKFAAQVYSSFPDEIRTLLETVKKS
jgi:hypothetical protein